LEKLSVIVPMLNEESTIARTLTAIRRGAPGAELIVVDGGSNDLSVAIASTIATRVISSARGRARQMNAGAAISNGDALVFVHADTIVPASFAADIVGALSKRGVVGGRFDLRLDSDAIPYRVIGALISLRSRISRTGTGDQAIFVRRDMFDRLGGFPDIELCEDLDFTRRLKRIGDFVCLRSRVVTSARRWSRDGLIRTVLRMWLIRSMYLIGVSPSRLKKLYADTR
jgi:rSAM/selenodomain-associated transferase 2